MILCFSLGTISFVIYFSFSLRCMALCNIRWWNGNKEMEFRERRIFLTFCMSMRIEVFACLSSRARAKWGWTNCVLLFHDLNMLVCLVLMYHVHVNCHGEIAFQIILWNGGSILLELDATGWSGISLSGLILPDGVRSNSGGRLVRARLHGSGQRVRASPAARPNGCPYEIQTIRGSWFE